VKTKALLLVVFCTLFSHARAPASDLARIDRHLAREPAYKNTPQYCLLVFGQEARFQVWMVIDGETLYVDRNGNGDLTEKDKCFELKASPRNENSLECVVGDLIDPCRKTRYSDLRVTYSAPDWFSVSVETILPNPNGPHLSGSALPHFAARPADAPIVHFGGPLTMTLSFATCGDRPAGISTRIGTPGVGKGSFVDYSGSVLQLTRAQPDIELEYPDNQGATIREKAKLQWNG
jgi:hypothetical protein